MFGDSTIEGAERAARGRALLMTIGAAVIALNAWLQWGDSGNPSPDAPSWTWVLLVLLWAVLLATGGGLALGKRMRALINDELSLRNRARAIAGGFYAMLAAASILYLAEAWIDVAAGDAMKAVTASGLATALLVYAWLEW
jgi:hypothetical protein